MPLLVNGVRHRAVEVAADMIELVERRFLGKPIERRTLMVDQFSKICGRRSDRPCRACLRRNPDARQAFRPVARLFSLGRIRKGVGGMVDNLLRAGPAFEKCAVVRHFER